MSSLLIIFAFICALIAIIGSVVPALPGPPLGWIALLLLHFSDAVNYSTSFLIIMAVIAVIITVLDYLVPIWGTKRFGGTKSGTRGSVIGLVISVLVLPFLGITLGPFGIVGILAGPFLGAYIGERLGGNQSGALRAAIGSFVGFLAGTVMKLTYTIVTAVYVIKDIIF